MAKKTTEENTRTIAGRSGMEERLVTGRVLQQMTQALYTHIGLDIASAEARANAEAGRLIDAAIAALVDGEETLNTLRRLAEELARLEDEKGGSITEILEEIATLRTALENHTHNFADIAGQIIQNQIASGAVGNAQMADNSVDGRVLQNMGHGGATVGQESNGSGFDQTITIPRITVDAQGRVTVAEDRTFHIPEVPDGVMPHTNAPRPLGPQASAGSVDEFSRGDHVHELPSAEAVGAADREHGHSIGEITGGTVEINGIPETFQSPAEEFARRRTNQEADTHMTNMILAQQGYVTDDYVELRAGNGYLITRWEVVSEDQVTEMIARLR